jgi:hypothetical protein
MAIINSTSFAKALRPGVRLWFGKEVAKYPDEYLDIFEHNTSKMAWEEDVGQSGFGVATIKPEGGSITYDTMQQTYTARYIHVVYANGFIVTREMYEDGQGEKMGIKKASSLAHSLKSTKNIVGANVLNRAFNASYTMGSQSDGKELCATDHPWKTGGTWSNELATPADISEAALEQACIDIAGWVDARGLPVAYKPESLLIPKELLFETSRIMDNPNRPGTAERDINALNKLGLFPGGYKVNHYLTDPDAWFIKVGVPTKTGLNYFERRPIEFDLDNDFDTENARFKGTFRCSFGWSDGHNIFGSPGA